MGIFSRKARKMRPHEWFSLQGRHLHTSITKLHQQASSQWGVAHETPQATFEAFLPTYRGYEKIAGMAEALNGLAFQARIDGSLDGRSLGTIKQMCEHISATYADAQQSIGLMLFYPEDNGRLLPPNPTGEDWDRARRIGNEARTRFQAFWAKERPKYVEGESDAAAGYASMMTSYTESTGRPARRPTWQPVPPEMRPQ
jgi:hypothetical protein